MTINSVRQSIADICEDSIVFNNPSFDDSIIGISTDGKVVYSLQSMINEFTSENKVSSDEAYEFIENNVLSMLSIIIELRRPVIVDDIALSI